MGFGYLLFSYLMILTVGFSAGAGVDVFPDLLGYIFTYLAMCKLSPYSKWFQIEKKTCYPLFLVGGVTLICQLLALQSSWTASLSDLLDWIYDLNDLLLFFYQLFLLKGIVDLAKEVELPKLVFRAKAGQIMVFSYTILSILSTVLNRMGIVSTLSDLQKGIVSFISLFLQLYFYILFFFILFLLFSCYRQICYEGEEDVEPDSTHNPLEAVYKKLHNKKNR
jgi:hypothetical protein